MVKTKNGSFDLSVFASGDGAHCGLSDWYDEQKAALKSALESGRPFDTGWYASKKEIASARISGDGKHIRIGVSVSDDLDTEGFSEESIPAPATLEDVAAAISRVWEAAEGNQKDNQLYVGYSLIHYSTKIPDWARSANVFPRETRKRYPRKMPQCLDYYIVPRGFGGEMDGPPGDCYSWWFWQNDVDGEGKACVEEGIPKRTVKLFERFANRGEAGALRIGDWEIVSWDKEAV